MEITLGTGKVFVGQVVRKKDGITGLLLRPVDTKHPVGEKDLDWKNSTEYTIKDEDVVVWISCLESARVLQDRINIIVLTLNKCRVLDA